MGKGLALAVEFNARFRCRDHGCRRPLRDRTGADRRGYCSDCWKVRRKQQGDTPATVATEALPVGPNPTPGHGARNVDCRGYDACLTIACRSRWADFSCRSCALADSKPDRLAELARYGQARPYGATYCEIQTPGRKIDRNGKP